MSKGYSESILLKLIPADGFDPRNAVHLYTLVRDSSYQIRLPLGIAKQFDPWLTPAEPCTTSKPINEMHFGQGFFQPNLVAVGHS